MENDEIALNELFYGVSADIYDLIMNFHSIQYIQVTLKNMLKRTEQAQDKKLTTMLNDFNNFKALPR